MFVGAAHRPRYREHVRAVVWIAAAAAAVAVAVAAGSAAADPLLDLGDRNTTGRFMSAVAACGDGRAITLDEGGWLTRWTIATGERVGTIGVPDEDPMQAVACDGDLVLDARGSDVVLRRGDAIVARAASSGTLGAAIIGGRGYFADSDGVHQLPADGWTPWPADRIGLRAVVRPDLVVSTMGASLEWRTRSGAQQIAMPADVKALADLGDAIAVVDERGEVFVMTEPKLGAPAFTTSGDVPAAIAGDRTWVAVGLRDGKLVQARRTVPMAVMAPVQIERDDEYDAIRAIAIAGDAWLVAGADKRLHRVARGAAAYRAPSVAGLDTPRSVALDDTWLVMGDDNGGVHIYEPGGKAVAELHARSELGTGAIDEVGLTSRLVWARDSRDHLYRWRRPSLAPLAPIAGVAAAAPRDAGTLAIIAKGRLATLDLNSGAIRAVGARLDVDEPMLAVGGGIAVVVDHVEAKPSVVLDASTGALVGRVPDEDGMRNAVAVCADGSVVYADSETVHVWSPRTHAVVATTTLAAPAGSLACSASGRLAIGTWNGAISIRALAGLRPIDELATYHGMVLSLAWSKGRLASTGSDYHVQISEPAGD